MYEPVAEKPIATKAKIQISSADSTIFMNAVVLGCVIPSMKRTAVQRAWMPMSCDTSPIHDGLLTMKTRKKTRPRQTILNPKPEAESLYPEKTLRTRKYDREDLNLRFRYKVARIVDISGSPAQRASIPAQPIDARLAMSSQFNAGNDLNTVVPSGSSAQPTSSPRKMVHLPIITILPKLRDAPSSEERARVPCRVHGDQQLQQRLHKLPVQRTFITRPATSTWQQRRRGSAGLQL
jgi:hypothetical protein